MMRVCVRSKNGENCSRLARQRGREPSSKKGLPPPTFYVTPRMVITQRETIGREQGEGRLLAAVRHCRRSALCICISPQNGNINPETKPQTLISCTPVSELVCERERDSRRPQTCLCARPLHMQASHRIWLLIIPVETWKCKQPASSTHTPHQGTE